MNQDDSHRLRRITNKIVRDTSIANIEPVFNCFLYYPNQENVFKQVGILYAHDDTPYAGGKFVLDIEYPQEYPYRPPNIKFRTKIFHTNIDEDGSIWIDQLYTQWCAAIDIKQLILNIHSILFDPFDDDEIMLVPHVKEIYLNNKQLYREIAAEWTQKYAFD
ncbi:hypothetical protein pb186bvf_011285 [Paramecium bursaria]